MENKTVVEWLRHQFLVEVVEPTQEIFDRAIQMERDEASRLKDKEILGDRKIVELEHKLTVSRAEIERLKDEKNEALRLLNDALKLIHSLPDLLHDSLGECPEGNNYEIISINGERLINHKGVGSGEPLKQWIKSEIDKILSK